MAGYNENFLQNIELPLPEFSPALVGDVLQREALTDGFRADYVNYTIVMDAVRRAPILSALNIDQGKRKQTSRGNWRIDTRIGAENQLDNDYYRHNPWDRGHMARRASAAWGDTRRDAQKASDATFYYSNCSLQHENFNQDEWLGLEDWVADLKLDIDGRITVFSGPIYGEFSRTIHPAGRAPADIPSGYFKIVCFVNKQTEQLDVRAFLMYQDREALKDKQGRKVYNYQNYQCTVREIEELSGLRFKDEIYENNPLLYYEDEASAEKLNISHFPERIEVNSSNEIVDAETPRPFVADDEVDVYITGAMVNPSGNERDNEWVSILNLTSQPIDLSAWTLRDLKRAPKALSGTLAPGEAKSIGPLKPLMLSNKGGIIELWDGDHRIDRVDYAEAEVKKKDVPVIFIYRLDW